MASHYDILEVKSTASIEEIPKSFRKPALKYHPEKNLGVVDLIALRSTILLSPRTPYKYRTTCRSINATRRRALLAKLCQRYRVRT